MDDENTLLAEFYYYTVGDETTYNQELNDLHVCYTLARGLQLHCDRPRRPALPLEVILRITRHAGFIDPKPDLELASEAVRFALNIRDLGDLIWYLAGPLSRVQLASMARMQLVDTIENPKVKVPTAYYPNPRRFAHFTRQITCQIIPYGTLEVPSTLWAFVPFKSDEKWADGNNTDIVASLYACANEDEARALQKLTPDTIIGDTFGPDHEINKQLDKGQCPYVVVISQQPVRLLIWRWWEPRF
ncbi:hypothetical protein FRC10_010754 [Ceratobasidium sp. 414]|nr:hypothetical protein FRC10_010754 [Ceratobasidium sp. 414]